uniref:ANK_REP_REGION domain-containing protein n=1 Tax=Macrostomum lignano TaxID=282301 RepID=A0A1I8IJ38_9PLAT
SCDLLLRSGQLVFVIAELPGRLPLLLQLIGVHSASIGPLQIVLELLHLQGGGTEGQFLLGLHCGQFVQSAAQFPLQAGSRQRLYPLGQLPWQQESGAGVSVAMVNRRFGFDVGGDGVKFAQQHAVGLGDQLISLLQLPPHVLALFPVGLLGVFQLVSQQGGFVRQHLLLAGQLRVAAQRPLVLSLHGGQLLPQLRQGVQTIGGVAGLLLSTLKSLARRPAPPPPRFDEEVDAGKKRSASRDAVRSGKKRSASRDTSKKRSTFRDTRKIEALRLQGRRSKRSASRDAGKMRSTFRDTRKIEALRLQGRRSKRSASRDAGKMRSASRPRDAGKMRSASGTPMRSASRDAGKMRSASRDAGKMRSASRDGKMRSASRDAGKMRSASRDAGKMRSASRDAGIPVRSKRSASRDTGKKRSASRDAGIPVRSKRSASRDTGKMRSDSRDAGKMRSASRDAGKMRSASRDAGKMRSASRDTMALSGTLVFSEKLESSSHEVSGYDDDERLTKKWIGDGFRSKKWLGDGFRSKKWIGDGFRSKKWIGDGFRSKKWLGDGFRSKKWIGDGFRSKKWIGDGFRSKKWLGDGFRSKKWIGDGFRSKKWIGDGFRSKKWLGDGFRSKKWIAGVGHPMQPSGQRVHSVAGFAGQHQRSRQGVGAKRRANNGTSHGGDGVRVAAEGNSEGQAVEQALLLLPLLNAERFINARILVARRLPFGYQRMAVGTLRSAVTSVPRAPATARASSSTADEAGCFPRNSFTWRIADVTKLRLREGRKPCQRLPPLLRASRTVCKLTGCSRLTCPRRRRRSAAPVARPSHEPRPGQGQRIGMSDPGGQVHLLGVRSRRSRSTDQTQRGGPHRAPVAIATAPLEQSRRRAKWIGEVGVSKVFKDAASGRAVATVGGLEASVSERASDAGSTRPRQSTSDSQTALVSAVSSVYTSGQRRQRRRSRMLASNASQTVRKLDRRGENSNWAPRQSPAKAASRQPRNLAHGIIRKSGLGTPEPLQCRNISMAAVR